MKVLFINPPNVPFTEKCLLIEPIDILTAASYIQALGHNVKFIDMDVTQTPPEAIEAIIKTFMPDVTVIPFDYHIPLHTSDSIKGIKSIIKIAKNRSSKVIVAGKTSKHYPEAFLDSGADVIIRCEMELVLQQLSKSSDWNSNFLNSINGISYKNDNQVCTTEQPTKMLDLNTLPMADRNLINLDDYIDVRTILSSRGCPGQCSFCATPDFWGKWRCRSAVHVVDEIEYLVNNFKTKKILFLDDNATVNKQRMKEISNEIINRGIKVSMGCLGTISSYDRETMLLMHRAGFRWIHYGIESASQKVLNKHSKNFKVEYAKQIILETKEIGFRVRTSFIMDLPEIDEEGIKSTNDFILETQPDEIRLHYLSLRVGTKIFEEYAQKGYLPSQYIHSDKPATVGTNDIKTKIIQSVGNLTQLLKEKGYLIVTKPAEFKKIDKAPNIKFVSFCPSKYGVNWGI